MKKILIGFLVFSFLIVGLHTMGHTSFKFNVIDRVRIIDSDLPGGYIYGKIPGFAQKTLKGNPWMMDNLAKRKLASRIYPGGDHNKIEKIHVTIIANEKNPFGDDIVCYIILYNTDENAKKEIKKLSEYINYNSDRALLLQKKNLAIFLHVDDTENYHYIYDISLFIKKRLSEI